MRKIYTKVNWSSFQLDQGQTRESGRMPDLLIIECQLIDYNEDFR